MHLAEIWRYPVKSLGGEQLEEVEITAHGIPGDRSLHVLDGDGSLLTARRSRRMVTLPSRLGPDGEPVIDGEPWDSEAAAARVRDTVGNGANLVRSDDGHLYDDTALLIATDGALAWFGEDRRRFRPNLVVAGVDGLAERDWPGRRLRIGDALIEVRHVCERCVITTIDPDSAETDPAVLSRIREQLDGRFALNCEVTATGRVAVGDPVELL